MANNADRMGRPMDGSRSMANGLQTPLVDPLQEPVQSTPAQAPVKLTPEQIDDLADRLLSGDKAAIGQVESRPWTTDEFEAFLFSLEVELPKIVEGGPFKAGFGRQIVDSALAEYIAEDNEEPFGSILMDYVDGLDE